MMKKIKLSELSEPVRAFLDQVIGSDESIMVVDDQDVLQCGITPYAQATPAERRQAGAAMQDLQAKTARAMKEAGVTEEDIDRELQQDD